MAAVNYDYVIIESGTPQELSRKVKEMIADNYLPQGGLVIVALGEDDYLYAQAMTFNVIND